MDNKLTLRQIAPGLFSNPEGPAQIEAPSLQQQPMDPSMRDRILAALAQSGVLGKAENVLQQMPQQEDLKTLVNSLRNRAAEPPENTPIAPAATPSMQPSRPMRPIDQNPAQATEQAAQKIGAQVAPYSEDQDLEQNLQAIQNQRARFGGAK